MLPTDNQNKDNSLVWHIQSYIQTNKSIIVLVWFCPPSFDQYSIQFPISKGKCFKFSF